MSEDDRCEKCRTLIERDDYITEPDGYEEYWGAMVARPEVVVGYVCPNCEHKGEF